MRIAYALSLADNQIHGDKKKTKAGSPQFHTSKRKPNNNRKEGKILLTLPGLDCCFGSSLFLFVLYSVRKSAVSEIVPSSEGLFLFPWHESWHEIQKRHAQTWRIMPIYSGL